VAAVACIGWFGVCALLIFMLKQKLGDASTAHEEQDTSEHVDR
jgi:hypothetical protein